MHSFTIIPVIALFCYVFQWISLLAVKKNGQIISFMGILMAMIIWTGGSMFMRIGCWPGVNFWYHVSLTGLLFVPVFLFSFLRNFMEAKRIYRIYFWIFMTICVLVINYVTGTFLGAPNVVVTPEGQGYVYEFSWKIIFLFISPVALVGECVYMIVNSSENTAFLRNQMRPILLGLLAMAVGNLAVMLPIFEGFPIDVCSGIVMAMCMYYALYKKRMFPLNAVVSKTIYYMVAFAISLVLFYNIIPSFEHFLRSHIMLEERQITLAVSLTMIVFTVVIYMIFNWAMDKVFEKDENVQSKIIVALSEKMSYLMGQHEILQELMGAITEALGPEKIYIFLKNSDGNFSLQMSNISQIPHHIINKSDEYLTLLQQAGNHMLDSEYRQTRSYRNLRRQAQLDLSEKQIRCTIGISDEDSLIGIIMLSAKEDGRRYKQKDINFLMSLNSIASIALKNSHLYEAAYQEARSDYLTGVANRKHFYEVLQKSCEESKYEFGSLLVVNVDDFKLYNQLYGDEAGDEALKKIADIIGTEVTDECIVARYGGKEFATLLPERSVEDVQQLAERISRKIRDMNNSTGGSNEYALKSLTVSCGIATALCPMEDYHELVNNANMAVYYAKRAGKNRIVVYKEGEGPGKTNDMEYRPGIYSDYATTIYALTAAIDAKDHYTFNHSENVAYYARELARAYGMNEETVNIVHEAGLLHDIGKIGIREDILNKPGKLTPEEYEIIKTHVNLSIGIIRHLPSLDYVIPAVIGHHERFDGNGYPRGVEGNDIPLLARMLCIADSFDAMISKRSYKQEMKAEKALSILEEEAGKQFDPELVPIFVKLVKEGTIEVK